MIEIDRSQNKTIDNEFDDNGEPPTEIVVSLWKM